MRMQTHLNLIQRDYTTLLPSISMAVSMIVFIAKQHGSGWKDTESDPELDPSRQSKEQMRGLSATKILRPGLMLTGNLSRGEVYY